MSMPREGQRVAFCGYPGDGLAIDDRGKVLSRSEGSCHVLWTSGSRAGDVTLVLDDDLVGVTAAAHTYDDLDSGRLVSISVRRVFDGGGKVALLNALNEEGHLASFATIAEEALQAVAAGIRQDPSIQEVLASLEPEEGAEFVAFAATALLQDAFGGDD